MSQHVNLGMEVVLHADNSTIKFCALIIHILTVHHNCGTQHGTLAAWCYLGSLHRLVQLSEHMYIYVVVLSCKLISSE